MDQNINEEFPADSFEDTTGSSEGGQNPAQSQDLFQRDPQARKMMSSLQKREAEANKRASAAERAAREAAEAAASAQRQLQAVLSELQHVDPDKAISLAREAEYAEAMEKLRRLEAQEQAEQQARQWENYWINDFQSLGLDPYDSRVQQALRSADNGSMQRLRAIMIGERNKPPESPQPSAGTQIQQKAQTGAYTVLPDGKAQIGNSSITYEQAKKEFDAIPPGGGGDAYFNWKKKYGVRHPDQLKP